VIAAVARERQVELFAEWGHRWFDLKRTKNAHDVLSALPSKQPWAGDYQLLYPIPPVEIQINPRLMQNDEY
jgi:starch-binding outer membrane protein, SusD/RagB family